MKACRHLIFGWYVRKNTRNRLIRRVFVKAPSRQSALPFVSMKIGTRLQCDTMPSVRGNLLTVTGLRVSMVRFASSCSNLIAKGVPHAGRGHKGTQMKYFVPNLTSINRHTRLHMHTCVSQKRQPWQGSARLKSVKFTTCTKYKQTFLDSNKLFTVSTYEWNNLSQKIIFSSS